MNTALLITVIVLPLIAVMISSFITFNKKLQGKSTGKAMKANIVSFAVIAVLVCSLTFAVSASENADNNETAVAPSPSVSQETPSAQQVEEASQESEKSSSNGLGLLAAGRVTGLAGIGGGIAVAAGAPAAIAATSEDPKSFGKSLIFVALGESIALYGVVISILILNKV